MRLIERNDASAARLRLCPAYRNRALLKVNLAPAQNANLVLAERRVEGESHDRVEQRIRATSGKQVLLVLAAKGLADILCSRSNFTSPCRFVHSLWRFKIWRRTWSSLLRVNCR
jgi:hypothetical protein